jgi:hypothetical protein
LQQLGFAEVGAKDLDADSEVFTVAGIDRSCDLHHRVDPGFGERLSRGVEVLDDFIDDFAEFAVKLDGIIAVDSRNEIRAFAEIGLILLTPFHPLVVSVGCFHGWFEE